MYKDLIREGLVEHKTSNLIAKGNVYETDFVRSSKHNNFSYCFASFDMDSNDEFNNISVDILNAVAAYSHDVFEFKAMGHKDGFCEGASVSFSDISDLLIYSFEKNKVFMTHINTYTNEKTVYPVYTSSSVLDLYFLTNSVTHEEGNFIISVRNFAYPKMAELLQYGRDNEGIRSAIYHKANENKQKAAVIMSRDVNAEEAKDELSDEECPIDCASGYDDCEGFAMAKACKATFSICPLQVAANSINNAELHDAFIGNFDLLYSLRDDLLMESERGQEYIEKYYSVGKDVSGSMPLDLSIDVAQTIIDDSYKVGHLLDATSSSDLVLYSAADANRYTTLLSRISSYCPTQDCVDNVDDVKADVNAYVGKTVADIRAFLAQ